MPCMHTIDPPCNLTWPHRKAGPFPCKQCEGLMMTSAERMIVQGTRLTAK